MSGPPWLIVAAALGYLLGALPFGLLVARAMKGIDLRDYGSHRTGATNALRTIGARGAALVFVLDVAKGAAAVLLARLLLGDDAGLGEWAAALAGLAAIVGHNWSVFIRFTGGRGVATSAGALLALVPPAVLLLVPIVVAIMWRWRYVSLGSVLGALIAPLIVAALMLIGGAELPQLAYALAAGALVTAAHGDNIARLRAGTERRIGQNEAVR